MIWMENDCMSEDIKSELFSQSEYLRGRNNNAKVLCSRDENESYIDDSNSQRQQALI